MSDGEQRRLANDRVLYYDEPPEKTGIEGMDYFGYAMVYGLKQSVYKPFKAWVLDERPRYLDPDGNVQPYTGHIDRSGGMAVAIGTIASFFLPTPKIVNADMVLGIEGTGGVRLLVSGGKPVIRLAPEIEASLPAMGPRVATEAPLVELPVAAGGKTVGYGDTGPILTSGYGVRSAIPGYNGSVAVDAWRFAQESGVPFAPNQIDNFIGASGAYNATHVEAQILFLNPGTKFINVSKVPCCSCTARISLSAVRLGEPITVLSPRGFQWHMPDGTVVR